MSIWMSPLPVRDAYDALTRQLQYPSSETLRRILELAMSPEEAQLLQQMAEQPATIDALAQKLERDPKLTAEQVERLFWAGLVMEMPGPDGSIMYSPPMPYCVELACDHMMYAIGGKFAPKSVKTTAQDLWGVLDKKSQQFCDLWNKFFYEEWYRWQRPDELVHRRNGILGGAAE